MGYSNKMQLVSSVRVRIVGMGLVMLAVLLLGAGVVEAGTRSFTYTYETTTQPKGALEYEQWVTWKADKDTDRGFDRLDIRHELEYGITNNWQVALYLSDWRYEDGKSVSNDRTEWRDVAFETVYSLSDPTADILGTALYGELKLGPEKVEIEGKLLFQKNIGKWITAYNMIFEAEWQGNDLNERTGKFAETMGLSYGVSPAFSLGAEALHEISFAMWSKTSPSLFYAGPNASYRSKAGWWITVTALFQLTDLDNEPNVQTRMLFGIDF